MSDPADWRDYFRYLLYLHGYTYHGHARADLETARRETAAHAAKIDGKIDESFEPIPDCGGFKFRLVPARDDLVLADLKARSDEFTDVVDRLKRYAERL